MREKILLLIILAGTVSAAGTATVIAAGIWSKVEPIVCGIALTFWLIAGGLATVIMIYSGVRYIAGSDDPGARKNAKDAIIHTMVGLILVVVATVLVNLASSGTLTKCVELPGI